jgi:hypothetical protein
LISTSLIIRSVTASTNLWNWPQSSLDLKSSATMKALTMISPKECWLPSTKFTHPYKHLKYKWSLELDQHHRSTFFYPHQILFEIHRVFGFFCFRMLIFTDVIQSPIIFFGNMTLQIQDRLQIFQVWHPRFSVVTLNEKMCSSHPDGGLLFFYAPKVNCSPFNL